MNAEFRPHVTLGDSVRSTNSRSLINTDPPSDDPLLLFTPERPVARTFEIAPMRAQGFEALRDPHVSTANRLFSSIVALFLVAVSLGAGILIGFAGGYASAPRLNLPSTPLEEPAPATPAREGVPPTSDAVQTAQPAAPPVSAEPAVSPPAVTEARSEVERSRPAGRVRSATVASGVAGPGSIEVVSRPEGAQVALDGRVVGVTPLTISDVATGTHVIGIELPGFNRWATSVSVNARERSRVGASLSTAAPLPQSQ